MFCLSVSQIEGDKNWQENLPIDTKIEAIWSDGNTRAYKSDSLFIVLTFVVSWQTFCQLLFPYERCPCIRLPMWLLLTMANSCFVNQRFWLCISQCICSFIFLSTSLWLLIHMLFWPLGLFSDVCKFPFNRSFSYQFVRVFFNL